MFIQDLCEAIDDNNSLDICLVNDMRQCQERLYNHIKFEDHFYLRHLFVNLLL